ncbi:MAG: hypothetical protein ACKVS6_11710 [Planctomycetota bacterium]
MFRPGLLPSVALALLGVGSIVNAQSNTINGLDVKLGEVKSLTALGRTGTYPNGVNGLAMTTTSCNVGTVNVPWLAAMQENHPFIAFLIGKDRGGRFFQISDYSYCKHGFFALSNSQCTPCQNPSGGTFLGVGCSDTYSTGNNGDNFWLGPPGEINPFLGTWTAACSHFDKGEPAVGSPQDCDGVRSLTSGQASALGSVGHRIRVEDGDFAIPGDFYYQGYYVVRSEAENKRGDNIGSRKFTPTWNGNSWGISTTDAGPTYGSILQRWSGATVTSNTNGADDGRVYVGVKVTGPTNGIYHYEYAIHNRDNSRGVGGFRLPISQCTTITNFGFRDIDDDANNNWSMTQSATELTVSTTNNPIRWNSFYNIFFDSNAAPVSGAVSLDQFAAGAGASFFDVTTTIPGNLPFSNFGIGTPGCDGEHHICANSAPFIGNANFQLRCDNAPASTLGLGIVSDVAIVGGLDAFGLGFITYNDFALSTELLTFDFFSDANGLGIAPAPINNDVNLVGLTFYANALWVWTGQCPPPSPLGISSSNAVAITITN